MLDEGQFRVLFAKTPVKRTGRARFLRNCLIAAGNSGDATLLPAVMACLDDNATLIRGAAVWALGRLDRARLSVESWRRASETDPVVLGEWDICLG